MSHIHTSGIARVQNLNCALRSPATDSAINDVDNCQDIKIIVLQEPWNDIGDRHPLSINYNKYTPPGPYPRCATYIRKDVNLDPRNITTYGNHSPKHVTGCFYEDAHDHENKLIY